MNCKQKVALVGNPNSGKTTLFNKLTKSRHKTGNYPGVTIDLSEGGLCIDNEVSLVDLPGIYSLTSNSEEEIIARDFIIREKPDVVINIVDSSNLERSLYLTSQLMELQVPIIMVCNKTDLAKAHDIEIDYKMLSAFLEVTVIPANISNNVGIDEILKQVLIEVRKKDEAKGIYLKFSVKLEEAINQIESLLQEDDKRPRWSALKLIESDKIMNTENISEAVLAEAETQKSKLNLEYSVSVEEKIAVERSKLLSSLVKSVSNVTYDYKHTISDKIDKIILNKYVAIPIFFLLMYLVFQFTFTVGVYPSVFLQNIFQKLAFFISSFWDNESLLRSLLVDGVIGGVGSVLAFVPNILLLFIAISALEESGYMARVAFIMDHLMHKIGLHGRSFIPIIIGFGCTVPAIMSTRILENRRDRLTTILVLPLVACSAKLAVFTMLIPAFFSRAASVKVLFLLYLIGIVLAIALIKLLRRSVFKGENIQFIMDLPQYQIPSMKNILLSTWEKASLYVKKAGTFILSISILLWFLSVFPINKQAEDTYLKSYSAMQKVAAQQLNNIAGADSSTALVDDFFTQSNKQKFITKYSVDLLKPENKANNIERSLNEITKLKALQNKFNDDVKHLKNKKNIDQLFTSFMGQVGRVMEYVFAPLGFDWKINTALIGALSAKEVFITQLGIIFSVGESDGGMVQLQKQLHHSYTTLQGFCILLFLLISAPCIATIAMTKKETGSYKWAIIQLGFLTVLAYFITMIVYQIAKIWW